MKKAILSILMALLALAFYATDFILVDGSIIIGELKGINSGSMYIVDTSEQLHVIAMDNIQVINNGSGDVSSIWKRRKPFMDIDPGKYQGPNLVQVAADQKPNLLAPPPPIKSKDDKHLASISAALWTLNGIYVASLVVAVLTYAHLTKKP